MSSSEYWLLPLKLDVGAVGVVDWVVAGAAAGGRGVSCVATVEPYSGLYVGEEYVSPLIEPPCDRLEAVFFPALRNCSNIEAGIPTAGTAVFNEL